MIRLDASAAPKSWRFEQRPKAQVAQGYDAEFLLYDVVGSMGPFGGISAEAVYGMISGVTGGKVLFRINSAGGVVTEGMAIYNLLKECQAEVTTRVDGLAGSIASVIMLAGDKREIAPNAYVMIHDPYAYVEGGEAELRNVADVLAMNRDAMLDIYQARTGQDREFLATLCAKETYLSAEQAVKLGFCTRMTGEKAQILASFGDLSGAPEQLRNAVLLAAKGIAMDDNKDDDKLAKAEEEIKSLKARLEEMGEDKISALKEEIKNLKAEIDSRKAKAEDDDESDDDEDKPKDEADESTNEGEEVKANARIAQAVMGLLGVKTRAGLEGKLMAYIDRVPNQAQTHEARVKALIADGKLPPARKTWALGVSPADLDAYVKAIGDTPIVAVSKEHQPNEAEGRRRAKVETEAKVELTKEEITIGKQMGRDLNKMLAQKREALGLA